MAHTSHSHRLHVEQQPVQIKCAELEQRHPTIAATPALAEAREFSKTFGAGETNRHAQFHTYNRGLIFTTRPGI
jgi:hypothetical protein